MLDFIERLESAAEFRLDEMTKGMPVGYFKCGCGNIDELCHAAPSTDNPYSDPMCRKCLDKMLKGIG